MLLSAHKQANTSTGTGASEHLSELNKYEFSQQTLIQVPALCQLLEYLVMVLTYRPIRMRPQHFTHCEIFPALVLQGNSLTTEAAYFLIERCLMH